MNCSKCNTANSEGHRFCFNCGAPLGADRQAASRPSGASALDEGERRQLTVMFCDIVNSTALSMRYDPEELGDIIRLFQDACVRVVERYEGFVAQHLGDGLLIYFGYPRAHEDDCERAVHAGLGIVEAVATLQPRPGLRLQVRVGIATGRIVIGDLVTAGSNTDKFAVGRTPTIAARLQALAAPDTVLISPNSYRLLGQRFECRDIGVHDLKGVPEPLQVYEVLRQRVRQSRFAAMHGRSVMPLVGRNEEMALLKERTQQALHGHGQTVLLSGEPGIGKSRLTRALIEDICAQHSVVPVELQCSPYYNQNALFPAIEWLQEEIFTSAGTGPEWPALQRFLDRTTLDHTQARTLLAMLLSVPLPAGHPPLNLTPERQKQLTLQYLASLIQQMNPSPLVLLVVEDVHWADPSTLEFIRLWIADTAGSKAMTVLTARPEFVPPWPAQRNFTALDLGRLAEAQARELVHAAAGDADLPDAVMRQLVKKSDSIPLFLEVLTKHIVQTGRQNMAPGSPSDGAAAVDVPDSLQSALMARLDRMGETKSVAQTAAILGRDFEQKMLEAVWNGSPEALDRGLEELCAADLLQLRGEQGKGLFQFKHALIRDVAYDSVLKRNCESLHRHVADVMERSFPDIVARQPDVLAHHYTAGKEPAHAVRYWLAAGQLALKNFATQESVGHLNQGLALLAELPATPERDVTELELRILLGHALMTWKGYAAEELRATCARSHELCGLVGNAPQLPIALYQLNAYNVVSAHLATALDLAKQLLAIAEHVNDEDLLLVAHLTLGVAYFHLGEFAQAKPYLEKCVHTYDVQRHAAHAFQFGHDPTVVALSFLIWIHWLQGNQRIALQCAEQAISLARQLNHPLSLAFAITFAGWHRIFCRDYDAVIPISQEVRQFCTDQDVLIFLAHGHMLGAWHACDNGDLESGLPGIAAALDTFRMTGARHFLPYWEGHYAVMSGTAGDATSAEATIAQCIATTRHTGERWSEPELHRYRGRMLEKIGAPPGEAQACYREAIAVAQRQGALAWELRATLDLARSLLAHEAKEEARRLIESLQERVSLDIDRQSTAQVESILSACGDARNTGAAIAS